MNERAMNERTIEGVKRNVMNIIMFNIIEINFLFSSSSVLFWLPFSHPSPEQGAINRRRQHYSIMVSFTTTFSSACPLDSLTRPDHIK